MYNLNLKNFGSIKEADIKLLPFTIVTSTNNQGKTTIAKSLEFLCQESPDGFVKKDYHLFVNDEGKANTAELALIDDDDNEINITLPKGIKENIGDFNFNINEFSINKKVMDLKDKERFDYFQKLLNTLPTEEELSKKLLDELSKEFPEIKENLKTINSLVKADGYDSTCSHYQGMCRDAKTTWKNIAGETFGKDKSPRWQPNNWSMELETTSEKKLSSKLQEARDNYDIAISQSAVDEDKYNRMVEEANKKQAVVDLLAKYKNQKIELQDDLSNLNEVAKPAAAKQPKIGYYCPKCQAHLTFNGQSLVDYEETKKDENTKEKEDLYKNYVNEKKVLTDKLNLVKSKIMTGEEKLNEVNEAVSWVESNSINDSNYTKSDVDEASEAVDVAENNLKAFKAKTKADAQCRLERYYRLIADILSPNGIRKTVASKGVQKINKLFKKLFPEDIKMLSDFSILLDGRDYRMLSKSQKWRVDTSLKLINAILNKHDLVVIDELDILDNNNKKIWVKTLLQLKVNVLVLSSETKPIKLPNSYVIVDGVVKEVK